MAVAPKLRRPYLAVPQGANGALRVLVVDDEVAFANVMREVLDSFGLNVRVAFRADQALEMMREEAPDLLMVDVMMPEVDGLTLIRKVQKDPAWLGIPILVVSARAAKVDQHEALFAGADAFLAKPFTADELRQALRPFLPAGQSL
ncbi:MAG TPA: response regulator [Anaerolineales bacterium]|nr:response regulator [Anaerolineales bacterium]